jgi:putative tryptophan/tyrosine transport system substrate-binding protein
MRTRRAFITLLGGAAVAWPLVARGQQPAMPVIGFLGGADPMGYAVLMEAFRSGLRDHGYIERQNVRIEYRWAEGNYERLQGLAADLVRRKVDIIITQGTPAAFAAKQATTTIPIVMAIVGDPVDSGIVASYSRPGGNITGSSFFFPEINAKRLELMKSLMPGLKRAGVLMHPDNLAMTSVLRAMDEVAKAMDVKLQHVEVRRLDELDSAFAQAKSQIQAHTVIDEGLFIANAKRIAELAIRNRLPGVGFREYCEAGGLAAYGVNFPHIWRRAAAFVDKILKGTKPADLPIEQATRFEFIINLRTAKTLGLEVPPTLLARADEVIE